MSEKLMQTINRESTWRPKYWSDRDEMMDAALLLYLLVDEFQDQKEPGYARFKTNWPAVVVDQPAQMITRNPARPRIPLEDSRRDDRKFKSTVERWCRGVMDDIDRQLEKQGWTAGADDIAAKHLLMRGMAASELVMSEREQERRGSPIVYHWWDPRFTYPYFDGSGLNSVLYALTARLGDIMLEYDDAPIDGDGTEEVSKYIWYDREWYGVACSWIPKGRQARERGTGRAWEWLVPPYQHELDEIPVQLVAANQVPVLHVPKSFSADYPNYYDAAASGLTKAKRRNRNSPQSLWARSIYANIMDTIPQFNEFMSMLQQVIRSSALGTWFYLTVDGAPRFVELGSGTVNWGQLTDKIQRFEPGNLPPGLQEVTAAMFREMQQGSIPADLLGMAVRQATSGFHEAQLINLAMNSVGGFQKAHNTWNQMRLQSAYNQFAGKTMESGQPYSINAVGFERKTPFLTTIDSMAFADAGYMDIRVERRTAMPEDLAGRIAAARAAQDPANPVLDPWTVQDDIMQSEDPDFVLDGIKTAKAEFHSVLLYKALSQAMRERGESDEFIQQMLTMDFIQDLSLQMQKAQGMMQMQQMQSAMQPTGMPPGQMPPEQLQSGFQQAAANTPSFPGTQGANGAPLTGV